MLTKLQAHRQNNGTYTLYDYYRVDHLKRPKLVLENALPEVLAAYMTLYRGGIFDLDDDLVMFASPKIYQENSDELIDDMRKTSQAHGHRSNHRNYNLPRFNERYGIQADHHNRIIVGRCVELENEKMKAKLEPHHYWNYYQKIVSPTYSDPAERVSKKMLVDFLKHNPKVNSLVLRHFKPARTRNCEVLFVLRPSELGLTVDETHQAIKDAFNAA